MQVDRLVARLAPVATLATVLATVAARPALAQQPTYELGPESLVQEGVPQGHVIQGSYTSPEDGIYPGTVRDYWVSIPAQYEPGQEAALLVFNDGSGYASPTGHSRVPTVLDNLIAQGDMPVTIGVYINPGIVPPARPNAAARRNRSFEYDTMSDRYARFLIEEFLPMIEREHGVTFTKNPDLRGIGGLSTGGIAAFTVAWERPDSFRRVVTYIGTFVNIRHGDQYPGIIRKTSSIGRPIRVFMEDGDNDLNNLHGNWVLANQEMASALTFSGYENQLVVLSGGHSGNHGGTILPEALRWLFRDWAEAGGSSNGEG
jgi:enterochelin esterase family protein